MKHLKYISALIFLLLLTACGDKLRKTPIRSSYSTDKAFKNKVALLLPLSGPQKSIGIHMKRAAQISLFASNNENFELVFYDTKGHPATAANVAEKALKEGVSLIIGPLFSNTSLSVYQKVGGHVPIISLSNNESIAENDFYPFGFHASDQIDRLFHFLSKKGKNNIILLSPKSHYGALVSKRSSSIAKELNISLSIIEYIKASNLKSASSKIKQIKNADTIILPEGGNNLKQMISSLLFHDVKLRKYKLAGTGLWDSNSLRHQYLYGGWYPAVNSERRKNFEIEYQALYGQKPPRLATLSYDAVAMASILEKTSGISSSTIKNPDGFEGIDGYFKFNYGGKVDRSLSVIEVRRGGDIVVGIDKILE